MELIGWYSLFAVSMGLTACYELFWPILASLNITHPELNVSQSRYLMLAIFFIGAVVLAPLNILPCLVPSLGARFRSILHETLIKQ